MFLIGKGAGVSWRVAGLAALALIAAACTPINDAGPPKAGPIATAEPLILNGAPGSPVKPVPVAPVAPAVAGPAPTDAAPADAPIAAAGGPVKVDSAPTTDTTTIPAAPPAVAVTAPVAPANPATPPAPAAPSTVTAAGADTPPAVNGYPNVNAPQKEPEGKLLSPAERAKVIAELQALKMRQAGPKATDAPPGSISPVDLQKKAETHGEDAEKLIEKCADDTVAATDPDCKVAPSN